MDVNRQGVIEDRRSGMSLTQVAKKHDISRASVCKLMNETSTMLARGRYFGRPKFPLKTLPPTSRRVVICLQPRVSEHGIF
jgi:hypothetical protein